MSTAIKDAIKSVGKQFFKMSVVKLIGGLPVPIFIPILAYDIIEGDGGLMLSFVPLLNKILDVKKRMDSATASEEFLEQPQNTEPLTPPDTLK
jgi:hypothetical protein